MAHGGDLPPPRCPICSESIYNQSSAGTPTNVWDLYFAHMNPNHPEYVRWNKRMGSRYLLALIPLIGLIFLGIAIGGSTYQAPAPATIGNWIIFLSFPSTLPIILTVWTLRRKGTKKFRSLWKAEHLLAS